MSDVRKRLDLIEMALGMEPMDRDLCPKSPGEDCEDCEPDACPLVNNLLQATASQTEHLGHRIRRLELWLEQISDPVFRDRAGLLEQREQVLQNIQDVKASLDQTPGPVTGSLLKFLGSQEAKLEQINGQLEQLKQ